MTTAQRLTWWDRVLFLFGVETTWKWCVVGCTIGRHSWSYRQEKCRNGTPIIAGWFLTVITTSTEESARALCEDMQAAAEKYNKEKGYWV
jgi:hypothetical protein